MSRHNLHSRETCRDLLALTALDLRVHLICAGVEQVDGLVLQLPQLAVVGEVFISYSLTWGQFRGLDSYCRCLCYQWRLYRAGRQAEAEQPNHEQACCCV